MKLSKFILIGLLALMAHSALADIEGAPFIPEIDRRFDALEQGNHLRQGAYPIGTQDGHWVQQEVQATWNFAKQGGTSTVAFDLGVSLPKNAVITQTGIWSLTQPVAVLGGNLAFYCQNQYNLLNPTAAASFGAAGAAIAGTQNNTITNWSTVTAKCDIMAKIGGNVLTAGEVTIFVNYMIHQ